ncbi:exodeoxyribonuclease VII large subunit [Candidatus Saccharibacteria bacterium]|nr:exodeoxyribonuclease VII large subunit [Candidatus Saccharibacteria bacterium]
MTKQSNLSFSDTFKAVRPSLRSEKDESRLSVSFTPTEFISVVNQTLEYAYSSVLITGEVASFKVNQGKWVFFDIKDEESSVSCFMVLANLRIPLEDGMKVQIRAVPKVTKWGKFSLTVTAIKPVGEGSLKKAFELLKKKLASEGLFDVSRKRGIPKDLTRIGIISSTGAAGYSDFIKIINARWGGLEIQVAHTQVQGLDAPDQIIRALKYFNEKNEVQVVAIIRGGGSADDLSCFNDEKLVREIASSRIPVATGIGHERDESLCDLASDIRASTPSNLAEMLTPEKKMVKALVRGKVEKISDYVLMKIEQKKMENQNKISQVSNEIISIINRTHERVKRKCEVLEALNPEKILKQGYAILRGKISPGNVVKITTYDNEIKAEVKEVYERE